VAIVLVINGRCRLKIGLVAGLAHSGCPLDIFSTGKGFIERTGSFNYFAFDG
jgi:hypothetical protein